MIYNLMRLHDVFPFVCSILFGLTLIGIILATYIALHRTALLHETSRRLLSTWKKKFKLNKQKFKRIIALKPISVSLGGFGNYPYRIVDKYFVVIFFEALVNHSITLLLTT